MKGSHKAAERAERCSVISYRVGVVVLFLLAVLLIAGVVIIICNAIEAAHVGESF